MEIIFQKKKKKKKRMKDFFFFFAYPRKGRRKIQTYDLRFIRRNL
jgi:hypothetical protein